MSAELQGEHKDVWNGTT